MRCQHALNASATASGVVGCISFIVSSTRRHTIFDCDWSSDVCSSDLTSMLPPNPTRMEVPLERPKVAVSAGPLGMVGGVQLAAILQSPLVGLRFHVALPANAPVTCESRNSGMRSKASRKGDRPIVFMCGVLIFLFFLSFCERTIRSRVTLRKEGRWSSWETPNGLGARPILQAPP